MKAQNPPQANGHVAVAGKVVVDLQKEAQGGKPGKEHGGIGAAPVALAQKAQVVGQNHLFSKPHQEAAGPLVGHCGAVLPFLQLLGHIPVPDDGTGDELGKEGNI